MKKFNISKIHSLPIKRMSNNYIIVNIMRRVSICDCYIDKARRCSVEYRFKNQPIVKSGIYTNGA